MHLGRWATNLLTLFVSLALSLLVCEGLLRVTTPFPIGTKSNRLLDPRLGYRLQPGSGDVDADGFRNSSEKAAAYQVAAIGDSQTYGNNVEAKDSWPSALERMTGLPTYNFGVPSYGIYTYHPLVLDALEHDSKHIIVGLFPANDFVEAFSFCDIAEGGSPFWRDEKARLNLEALSNSDPKFCQRRTTSSFRTALIENVALLSAYQTLMAPKVESLLSELGLRASQHEKYDFPENIPSVRIDYVKENAVSSDLRSPEVATMLRDFERFGRDWVEKGRGRVSLLIVPSKERVIFQLLSRRNLLDAAQPEFLASVRSEKSLEDRIREIAQILGLPLVDAVDSVTDALDQSIKAGRTFYPDNDGHPYAAGYEAVALAASHLAVSTP
jgi:hypothetical protein